jgi:hypothetical protein
VRLEMSTRSIGRFERITKIFADASLLADPNELLYFARYVVNKAYALAEVAVEKRGEHFRDCIQEAAYWLLKHRHRGTPYAYVVARAKVICYLRGYALIAHQTLSKAPRSHLVAPVEEEVNETREAAVEAMGEIVYDLVANRMGLRRRCRHIAKLDVWIFNHSLRGDRIRHIMVEEGIPKTTIVGRLRYARRRLCRYLDEHGIEEVAAHYRERQHA